MSYVFAASYAGRCARCGTLFEAGTRVSYGEDDELNGADCCGARIDGLSASPTDVMPRGRSAKDRCPRCFIVPASNGVCNC